MTVKFNNDYLLDLYRGAPQKGKPQFGADVVKKFRKAIQMLQYLDTVADIRQHRGLNFELLQGDMVGFCSVRLDLKYRLILTLEGDDVFTATALVVEDLTNHYQ